MNCAPPPSSSRNRGAVRENIEPPAAAPMSRYSVALPIEVGDLSEDVRQIFETLASTLRHDQRALSGECRPPIDVLEADDAVKVVMDLCGVPAAVVRVLFRSDVLLIAGEKAPAPPTGAETFHQVEREFGRFARGVRLDGAFDVQRSHASLRNGELTIVLPKLAERRGQAHPIAIAVDDPRV